jgi:Family of unknown function (DUF6328)
MPTTRPSDDPDESEAQRLNRNFEDLLQELRVSQNGTQILFAFLLTVPFSNGFGRVTPFQQGFYFSSLILAATSAALLIAPAVMHRVLFRQGEKRELVIMASKVALGGQALLTFSVSAAVFLVGDFLYGHAVGIAVAVFVQLWTTAWFFALPIWMRLRRGYWAVGHTSST